MSEWTVSFTDPIKFSAGQYIRGHPMCGHPHGHTYFVRDITVTVPSLNEMGMVVDFGVIKKYIKDYWDHHEIVEEDDYGAWISFLKEIDLPYGRVRGQAHTTVEHLSKVMAIELRNAVAQSRGLEKHYVKVSLYLSEGPGQGSPAEAEY